MDNYLMHRGHKYLQKKRVNGKWRYYYSPNRYEINSSNYNQRKKELMKDPEWQNIVKSRDPEYVYTDQDGNTRYRFDNYLVNKKHPVLDALTDIGNGRKISVLDQDVDTFIAGAKDYIEMGKRTIENVLTIGVGILTTKIKNQQGSYDEDKKHIQQQINTASKIIDNSIESYDNASKKSQQIKNQYVTEENIATVTKIGESFLQELLKGY